MPTAAPKGDTSNSIDASLHRQDDSVAPWTSTPAAKRLKSSDEYALNSVTPIAYETYQKIPLDEAQAKEVLQNQAKHIAIGASATKKRTDYLCWDDYFMAVAQLSSLRSKSPRNPSGCCIVDSRNRVIGIGYNGFPMGCDDDILPWVEPGPGVPFLHSSQPFLVTAIQNAILCSGNVNQARIYVSEFPSNECAKVIIQSNVSKVIYQKEPSPKEFASESLTASRIMFQMAGITVKAHSALQEQISLVRGASPDESSAATDDKLSCNSKTASLCTKGHVELMRKEANFEVQASTKRTDYLSWDDYFMWMAFLSAKRSKDPNTQVGACLVLNQRIVGLGYNGFPAGCNDDWLPWSRQGETQLHTKYPYVCHAEVNAILNRIFPDVKGASLYVALFPCNECAKVIVQAGIREVIYMEDKYHDTDSCRASRIMFAMAGVKLRKHVPVNESLFLSLASKPN